MTPLLLTWISVSLVARGSPLYGPSSGFQDFEEHEFKTSAQWIDLDTVSYHDFQPQQMTLEDVDRSSLTLVPDSVVALIPLPVQSKLGIQDGKPLYVIRNLFYADICCGKGRIAKWFMLFGMKGMPIDIIYGPQFNLTTLSGLALAIIVVLRIVDKGFIMCQPQCSWFVWVSRSVHQQLHMAMSTTPKIRRPRS